jgi:uncharacterized protein
MATLSNETKKQTLVTELTLAKSFFSRLKGLLGRKELHKQEGLWIEPCNSIHTFFMRFPIDVAFVDSELVICELYSNLAPMRMTLPKRKAKSVFELPTGTLSRTQTEIGDRLNVVYSHS